MKIFISVTGTLLLGVLNVYSHSVSGTIYDAISKNPIPNVHITDMSTGQAILSNEKGYFVFETHSINTSLAFSHISYELKNINLNLETSDTSIVVELFRKDCEIEEVVVSSGLRRFITNQSYSHTCIYEQVIEEKIASSLIDILEDIPGITKQGEYFSPITLRGLGGKRILITKDGNRRMGNFSSGFMGQGINIYDTKKVEVIKGPASVIYGSGAISGIINIETKSIFSNPGISGRLLTSYGTNNNEQNYLAGINYATLDHAISFSCRFHNADNYTSGDDNVINNTSYSDKDARLSYSWKGNNELEIKAESELHVGGPWGHPAGFNGTNYMKVTNKTDNTWHSSLTALWHPEKTFKKTICSIYFDQEERNQTKDSYDVGTGRLSYCEETRYKNHYFGWRNLTEIEISNKLELKTGLDGVVYRIESPTTETDYFLSSTINNRVTKNAGVLLSGLFGELEWGNANERVKLRMGLRADYASVSEGEVHDTLQIQGRNSNIWSWSGTTSIVYKIAKNNNLSFQFARSCRMPDAKEMFIVTSSTDGIIYGNPNLTPEYGINLDAGFRGHAPICAYDLSLFANFLNDFISLEYWKNSGKKGINYTYMNIKKARIYGMELSLSKQINAVFHPDNSIHYNATLVYTQGDNISKTKGWVSKGLPLRAIPPLNTFHECIFRRSVSSSFSIYLSANIRYYATQNRIDPTEGYVSPSYCLIGAGSGIVYKRKTIKWELKIRGDNLTNNTYYPFETLVHNMGRNYKAMLIINF